MVELPKYSIQLRIVNHLNQPKTPVKIKANIFGYIEWKSQYLIFEEGVLQLLQTDYDFMHLYIKIFEHEFSYSDVQIEDALVEIDTNGISKYHYRISDQRVNLRGEITMYPHFIHLLFFPKIIHRKFHPLEIYLTGMREQGYQEIDPHFTSKIIEITGIPRIHEPKLELALQKEKNRQKTHRNINEGKFEEVLKIIETKDPKQVKTERKRWKKSKFAFQTLTRNLFLTPNQTMKPAIDKKTIPKTRKELHDSLLKHAEDLHNHRQCHRCNTTGIPYSVRIIGDGRKIIKSICIYNFCSECITVVRKDHPDHIYIPLYLSESERESYAQKKLKEYAKEHKNGINKW